MMKAVLGVAMEETNEFRPFAPRRAGCFDPMLIDVTAPYSAARWWPIWLWPTKLVVAKARAWP